MTAHLLICYPKDSTNLVLLDNRAVRTWNSKLNLLHCLQTACETTLDLGNKTVMRWWLLCCSMPNKNVWGAQTETVCLPSWGSYWATNHSVSIDKQPIYLSQSRSAPVSRGEPSDWLSKENSVKSAFREISLFPPLFCCLFSWTSRSVPLTEFESPLCQCFRTTVICLWPVGELPTKEKIPSFTLFARSTFQNEAC